MVFTKNRRASLVATPPPEFEVLMSIHEKAIGHVRQESVDAFVSEADLAPKQTWFHPSKAGTSGPSVTAWQAELEVGQPVPRRAHASCPVARFPHRRRSALDLGVQMIRTNRVMFFQQRAGVLTVPDVDHLRSSRFRDAIKAGHFWLNLIRPTPDEIRCVTEVRWRAADGRPRLHART